MSTFGAIRSDSTLAVESVADYGAVGDGTSNPVSEWLTGGARDQGYANLAAIQVDYPHVTGLTDEIDWVAAQAAHNALPTNGGRIGIPPGTYVWNKTLTLSKTGVTFQGAGWGNTSSTNGSTRISVSAAVSGFTVAGGHYSQILDLHLVNTSGGGAGNYDGISYTNGVAPVIKRVSCENFGRNGVRVDSTAGNMNHWCFEQVRVSGNLGDGFAWIGGSDGNAGVGIILEATANGGWGINLDGGAHANVFIMSHVSANTLGGHRVNTTANKFLWPYTEGGTGDTFVFTASSARNHAEFPYFGQATTITNSAGATNHLSYTDASNLPVQTGGGRFLYSAANTNTATPGLFVDNPVGGSQTSIQLAINGSEKARWRADDSQNVIFSSVSTGNIYFRSGGDATDLLLLNGNTKEATSYGDVTIATVGKGLKIKEGSNATMGAATLVNGTVTVSTTAVTASSRIFLTRRVAGGTVRGMLEVGTITAATSFVINAVDTAGALVDDDSAVSWLIIEPA
jgi:hypothetical protein